MHSYLENENNIIMTNEEESNVNIGLTNVLKELGLSSVQGIHKITGIDKPTISRHLNHKQPLTASHMQIYAKKLNTDISFFISGNIAKYPVSGYCYSDKPEVSGKNGVDDHEFIFFLQRYKIDGTKFIWNEKVNRAFRYNINYSEKRLMNNLLNRFCFVRTSEKVFEGLLGVVNSVDFKKNIVDVKPVWEEKTRDNISFVNIYPIGVTYDIDFSDAYIKILLNGKTFLNHEPNKDMLGTE